MDTMEVDASMTDQQAEPQSLVQAPQASSSKVSDSVLMPSGEPTVHYGQVPDGIDSPCNRGLTLS